MAAEIPTEIKIVAIIVVASWACAGAIRLLYPGVWKWIMEKLSFLWRPCSFCYHYLFPEAFVEQSSLKRHYILPISFPSDDRESFSQSFAENGRRRKSEGSLRLERRNTELNVAIPTLHSTESQNIDVQTPKSSQIETRNRSQSKTKKEGRRRGQGWGRGGLGRGRSGRGRFARESGFDYPFNQPNYDYPPDTVPHERVRGPSEFDILNPLQPQVDDSHLFNGQTNANTKKLHRSYSTNTTSFSDGPKTNPILSKGRNSDISPKATVSSVDNLLDL